MPPDKRSCKWCGVRLIFPVDATGKKLPPVNYHPDPVGTVGVVHEVTGTYRGRFLAAADSLGALEHRHALHHCEGMERQRQRGQWSAAVAARHGDQRRRRGKRRGPDVSGVRVAPPTLPGMP